MKHGIEQWQKKLSDEITALERESRLGNWVLGLIALFSILVVGGLMAQLKGF